MPDINWAPITEFIGRNWLFTLLLGAIGWLIQRIFSLQENNAILKTQLSFTQEQNSELKEDSKLQIKVLKEEIVKLQTKIQEKYTEEAIFSKYEFDQGGVPIHKTSQKPYCAACLHSLKKEVPLEDDPTDNYWRCTVTRDHYYEKTGRSRRPPQRYNEGPLY